MALQCNGVSRCIQASDTDPLGDVGQRGFLIHLRGVLQWNPSLPRSQSEGEGTLVKTVVCVEEVDLSLTAGLGRNVAGCGNCNDVANCHWLSRVCKVTRSVRDPATS